jgi:anaerobic magnesium-protoporphyrin IX monomethyl ester cyclase
MNPKRLLLVYPKLGLSGSLGRYLPLSLLYAAVDALKAGFAIDLVDVRLATGAWQAEIAAKMTPDTLLLGLSVMTGTPIKNATEISRWAKAAYPQVKIVWGGPHATFNGEEILQTPEVDYAIAGYGSRPLGLLARCLRGDAEAPTLAAIAGLLYRGADGQTVCVPPDNQFEMIDYRDIPYHLVEANLAHYGQLDTADRIFPMYSVMGCPYQCAFCSSPAMYRQMARKNQPLSVLEVADHIAYVHQTYGATYIYFIDDDSFVNLGHVEAIIDELNRRGLKIRLGFRGARINEIMKMDDAYLNKLAAAGTNILHIGAESGSQRLLDLMHKNCTVEDIVAVNQKMARHPEIKTGYNWIVGIPGETLDDLRLTRELMLRLINDNPGTIIFPPNKYRPLPGTEFYALALKAGYQKPTRLEDWANVEVEGVSRPPWYTPEAAAMINMLQVVSYFIDNKVFKLDTGNSLRFRLIRFLSWLYRPVALFRLKRGFSAFLIEDYIFRWAASLYRL